MTRKRKTETDLIVSAPGATAPARRKATTRTRAARATEAVDSQAIPAVEPDAADMAVVIEPSREEIAALAYSFWEARGYQGGSPEEDWVRAERELKTRVSAAVA